MVFLPGTFFAVSSPLLLTRLESTLICGLLKTVFSMGFFNWFGTGSQGGVVSKYFWIYVLFTAFSTLLTLGSWWYFASYRHSRSQRAGSEEEMPLV